MSVITQADWGRIHARAWTDKEFAEAFEKDPRAAIRKYGPDMDIDPEARFEFQDRPQDLDDESAKKIAEGSAKPQPMYCC